MKEKTETIDFSKGAVWKLILAQAVPLTIAQIVQLLYNVVDRIYIGHMKQGNSLALTGVGLTFPVITLVMAFTALFGIGGVPLFSMARGAEDDQKAKKILGNSCALLLICAATLTVVCYVFCKPILFAFGASGESFRYAKEYLDIYLLGTVFSVLSTGPNGYINAQGFPKVGMLSVVLGAVVNIVLDPIFIFGLDMGVSGAALATVLSQAVSTVWVLSFLMGKRAVVQLSIKSICLKWSITKDIFRLGTANFIMQGTTCLVQVACNSTLQSYGGDVYVGIMTVVNSVREILMLPVSGIMNGALPVIGFNYGARKYSRVRAGIRFNALSGALYTLLAWIVVVVFPSFWFGIFSDDPQLAAVGSGALKTYFFGFVFMALQFAGQSTFQALGEAKHAIFFSLLRKAFIVVPLTYLLPVLGFGADGVFLAEPVSNLIGGVACFLTMRFTVYKRLENEIS